MWFHLEFKHMSRLYLRRDSPGDHCCGITGSSYKVPSCVRYIGISTNTISIAECYLYVLNMVKLF